MSQPPSYTPVHAFVSDSANLANFPGQQLDVEFNDVKATTDAISANLKLIQRDDGALANGLVTFDSLSASLQVNGLAAAAPWATGINYQVGAAVVSSNNLYRCLVAHISGTFAVDLAAAKWSLVSPLLYSGGANITFTGSVISLSTSPVLTTPNIGVATATSINGNTFTSGTYTLTGAAGKTFTFSNNLTLAGTDGTTITFQGTDTYVGRGTTDTLTNKTLTSPTLTTPVLGAATATTINLVTITAPATGSTLTIPDGVTMTGPAASGTVVTKTSTDTLTNKTLDSAGTGNVLKVSGVTVSAGQYPGTITNDSATAGNVGEFVSTTVLVAAQVAMANNTPKDVATISLTAGEWEVWGNVAFNPAGTTTVSNIFSWINTVANTAPVIPNGGAYAGLGLPFTTGVLQVLPTGRMRLSLSGTTTVSLGAQTAFGVAGMNAYGFIGARRVR